MMENSLLNLCWQYQAKQVQKRNSEILLSGCLIKCMKTVLSADKLKISMSLEIPKDEQNFVQTAKHPKNKSKS